MITVNNLCDFHHLYTSLSVTFAMYFNGWNKGIISVIIIIITIIIIVITMRWISNYNNNNNNNDDDDLLTDPLGGSSLLELPCARTKRHPTTAYTGQHKK